MERSLVSVLTLVTLVTATPHGYGVKGGAGASAKAEASAVAGAFGDFGPIPLSIPSGSAYSGSFAKSSASSFASSSASSSSSSYSFSGSGTNGITGIGSDKGCSSGTCPGAGAAGSPLNGVHQLPGANAVSAAQSKALSGLHSPCQGSNCNGSPPQKCSSGQCLTDSALNSQNGCTGNGNCQSPSSVTDTTHDDSSNKSENDKTDGNISDTNDFAVNINRNPQSKISHDSNGQNSNSQDKSYNPQSDCINGKCGPANSGDSSLGINQDRPPVPSTYLTTPNKNPPCTTLDCHYPSHNTHPETGGLPSSYSVPIQSATNPPSTYYSSPSGYSSVPHPELSVNSGIPCTSSSCNSSPYNIGNFAHQNPSNQGPCTSGQCDISTSSNGKTNDISSVQSPQHSHGTIPSNVPLGYSGQPGCTNSYCSGQPTYSSLPTSQPGGGCKGATCSGSSLTGSPAKPSDSSASLYTGGFGGPPGFLDIASGPNKLPVNSGYGSHNTPGFTKPTGGFGLTSAQGPNGPTSSNDLNSNNNNNYGSTHSSSDGSANGALEHNKPSSVPSSLDSPFNPSGSSSYGAPTASSSIPLATTSHSKDNGIYKPTTNQIGSSPVHSGNIDGSTGSSYGSSGSNSIHSSFGVTKPNTPSLSSPAYTGGFGAPSGTVGGSGLSFGSTGTFNKPGSGNCGSVDCNSQSAANANGGSSSHDKINPNTSHTQEKPIYTGGFGGPTGLLNPNNVNIPSNTATGSSGNVPCASGSCGSQNTPLSHGSSISSAHNVAVATANADAVVYAGGFGGPPGVLKPYDDGKVNIPANGHSLSSNNGHPSIPSDNNKNTAPGSSLNGANAAAHAGAIASATAGSYGGSNQNNGASRGCNSGCSPNGAVDGLAGSVANAKSSAGAYGSGASFASSSASAHASAGAATKGGYGRK